MARRLISSDKVDGTSVTDRQGRDLGKIDCLMIDKVSGRVAYAVLSYGTVLGMGGKLYPVPWDVLEYDTKEEAYVISLPEEKIKSGQGYNDVDEMPDAGDAATRQIHQHYGSRADWYEVV
jgi:hypothetical protein